MLTIQFTTESVSRTGSQLNDIAVMDKVFVFVSEDYLMKKIFSNALFEAKERESAVSPVVGVMLMLVVTIIIAATVSAFAGGLVGTADKAPQAAFEVKISLMHQDWGGIDRTMTISHLGGDPIDTARLKIITSWTNKTANIDNYRETTPLPSSETPYVWTYKGIQHSVNLSVTNADVNGTTIYHEPYFVIPNLLPSEDGAIWFGNYILHSGEVMKVQGSLDDASWYNANGYAEHSVIKNSMQLTGRDVVNVKFVDIPTGQIIFNKDIYVTEG